MAGPFFELDISRELTQLSAEPEGAGGQNARTLVKFDDLRIVLITLKSGARMPDHHSKGSVSIHVVHGHIVVGADGRTFDLHAGRLLALAPGVPHDVAAAQDSVFLLTIAWPAGSAHNHPLG